MSDGLGTGPAAQLVALHADIQPPLFSLLSSTCTIGRSSQCQIVVHRPSISRLHARIERDGLRYLLSDANSVNGTFVNGERLQEPHILRDQDVIGLSSAEGLLRFLDPDRTVTGAGIVRLTFDKRQMVFSLDQQRLDLAPTLFRLLSYLYQHPGQLCTREQCAEAIWGPDYAPGLDADALDKAVSTLRARLRQVSPSANLIATRAGVGYILTP